MGEDLGKKIPRKKRSRSSRVEVTRDEKKNEEFIEGNKKEGKPGKVGEA